VKGSQIGKIRKVLKMERRKIGIPRRYRWRTGEQKYENFCVKMSPCNEIIVEGQFFCLGSYSTMDGECNYLIFLPIFIDRNMRKQRGK